MPVITLADPLIRSRMLLSSRHGSRPRASSSCSSSVRPPRASAACAIDGTGVTLTVKRRHQDANGSSTETWTQTYVLDHGTCQIAK
jgi:hypothetical protein